MRERRQQVEPKVAHPRFAQRHRLATVVTAALVVSAFFLAAQWAKAHVAEGTGEALQLHSGWCTTPPVIDGEIALAGNPNEWRDAFVRRIVLWKPSDSYVEPEPAYILLMNDATYLYVGLIYYHDNGGNPNRITFYFDEGSGGGDHNGAGNHGLSAGNEDAISTNEGLGAQWDRYWDGGAWVDDTDPDSSGVDFLAGVVYYTDRYNWEFRIPLNNAAEPGDDLNALDGGDGVAEGDEIGFLLEILRNGGGDSGTYYWDKTNADSTDASGWADIRLGKPKPFVTFGASKNVKGSPVVDGSISENAYVGSYMRKVLLTNFEGSTLDATLYFVQDSTGNHVYAALKVYDADNDAGDYCQIYQEQTNLLPAADRDYVLDGERENALRVQGAALTDWSYENPGGGANGFWQADIDGIEAQQGTSSYVTDHWEYEFRIDYEAGNDASVQDLYCTDTALIGFLLRYHDDSMPAGEQEFWWDYTVNSDSMLVNQTSDINISVGWAYLQLGAPFVQIVHPEDGAIAEGLYPIDVYVVPEPPITIDSVQYQYAGPSTSSWITIDQVGDTFWWAENWDTTALVDGDYELRVKVIYAGTSEIVQIINVTVNNVGGASVVPVVAATAPGAGAVVNGDNVQITFNIDPDAVESIVDTEISIDGGAWTNVTTQPTAPGGWDDGSHTWNTLASANGSHVFRVRAQDSSGRWGYSELRLVVVSNNVDVTLTAPAAGTVVNGTVPVTFDIDPEAGESIVNTQISIDGGAWVNAGSPPTAPGNWDDGSHSWDTLPYANGSHTIYVRTQDSNGRWGYSEIRTVIISNYVNVTLNGPGASSIVTGVVTVTFTVTPEVGESIVGTQIAIDGGSWADVDTPPAAAGGNGSHDWDTKSYPNGSHIFQVRAQNSNGWWGYSEIRLVTVSNEVTVTLTAPDAGELVNGTVSITVQIDPVVGETILDTEISIDGAPWVDLTNPPTAPGNWDDGSHAWDTTTSADGSHTLQVRAQDSNSHWGYSLARLVVVDNTPPVITDVEVKCPSNRTTAVTGDVLLVSAGIHDAIAGVDPSSVVLDSRGIDSTSHLMVDDGTSGDRVAGDGIFSCEITVTVQGNGAIFFWISASDNLGNAPVPAEGVLELRNRTRARGGCTLDSRDYSAGDASGWFLPVVVLLLSVTFRKWRMPMGRAMRRMRIFRLPTLAAVFLLCLPPVLYAQRARVTGKEKQPGRHFLDAPLMMQTNDFLHALFSVPPMEQARTLDKDTLLFHLGFNYSQGTYEDKDLMGTSTINTDAAFRESYLHLGYGLARGLEVRATFPYGGWRGDLELIKEGESVFEKTEVADGSGSLCLGIKCCLHEHQESDFSLGVVLSLKLPNGSKENYVSTDATDTSVSLVIDKGFGNVMFHLNFGMTKIGDPTVFRKQAKLEFKDLSFFGFAMNITMGERFSLICQVQGNTNAIDDVELEGCKTQPASFILGARYGLAKGAYVEVGSGMGLTPASSDMVFHVGLAWSRF